MTEAAIDTGVFGDRYVSLGEPVTDKGIDGAWALRIYIKPFVDWIWGGCFLMALGGFLAMADRRYRLAVKRSAIARRWLRRTPHEAGLMKSLRLARSARGLRRHRRVPVASGCRAIRAKCPRRSSASRRPRSSSRSCTQPDKTLGHRRHEGPGVAAQRVGVVVRVVPRRASAAGASSRRRTSCRSSASTTRTSTPTGIAWLEQHGDPYRLSVVDADGRVGIDWGVYGVPETFVVDKQGIIRYKQIGPVTVEALQQKILPLVRELQKS